MTDAKLPWSGTITGVQPRIRLHRSFDQRSHSYSGYLLRVDGELAGEEREFLVAVGKAAHAKQRFRVGDALRGMGHPATGVRGEIADLYKVSALKFSQRAEAPGSAASPPFHDLAPELTVYRARGHRRLAARTLASKCRSCVWGCLMPVDITIDQWNPSQVKFREEAFCYGPKSCPNYASGPARNVAGRNGMVYTEEDWVDEDATAHRGPDE